MSPRRRRCVRGREEGPRGVFSWRCSARLSSTVRMRLQPMAVKRRVAVRALPVLGHNCSLVLLLRKKLRAAARQAPATRGQRV